MPTQTIRFNRAPAAAVARAQREIISPGGVANLWGTTGHRFVLSRALDERHSELLATILVGQSKDTLFFFTGRYNNLRHSTIAEDVDFTQPDDREPGQRWFDRFAFPDLVRFKPRAYHQIANFVVVREHRGQGLARLLLDMRECRAGAAAMVGSGVCYLVSAASYFGLVRATNAGIQQILTAAPLLMGHWLLFTAIVANARFVVLDAQGLVTVKRRAKGKRAVKMTAAKSATKTPQAAATSIGSSATLSISRQTIQTVKTPADANRRWEP